MNIKNLILSIWRFIQSTKLTVICLVALMLLTFWGTLYQTHFGLYLSQQRFFHSWIVWISFVPFPGGLLVMWIFSLNLLTNIIWVFKWSWKKSGILIMHWGMMILMVGSGITFYTSEESSLTLKEGEWSNVAESFHLWEVSLWTNPSIEEGREVVGIPMSRLQQGMKLTLASHAVEFEVQQSYDNAVAFRAEMGKHKNLGVTNATGIVQIAGKEPHPEVEQNFPGLELIVKSSNKKSNVLLFGGESQGTQIPCGQDKCWIQLRRKRVQLPFTVRLIDFKKETYTNSSMAKSYESLVEVEEAGVKRESRIWMNNPFRSQGMTLFQSSFTQSEAGESSTFQVVYNPGRMVPYISSIVTGLGMAIHFLILSMRRRKQS